MKEMDSNFHFGPARSGEQTVYGARTPDASPTSILEWADFMRSQCVTRVCCLLDAGQLAGFPVNLEAEYKRLFGATCVLMELIADHHLCSRKALKGNILPFLRTADTGGERAVIHCWGGNGRTGHVLATPSSTANDMLRTPLAGALSKHCGRPSPTAWRFSSRPNVATISATAATRPLHD